jgi:acetyl-CoA carboxylase biotin carboxylase subunit
MLTKVLVANRGEIALRVMRACHEAGIATVAIHSTADAEALHVKFADESVCVGPPLAGESYLNVPRLIAAAEITGADGIHPGYGFLAENAEFAEMISSIGIKWIGPAAQIINRMGDKDQARRTALEAGVPVVPGSEGILPDAQAAARVAESIGYPVMVKAVAGGGGKGMRPCHNEEELLRNFVTASNEARSAFKNGDMYLEKLILRPRHVEIQVIGDEFGKVCHLGERDCSVQRRHQKLIEEAPSPAVDESLRRRMGEAAVKLCHHVGYTSAGTIEFLLDEDGSFYFMEMNTRIQVEHPVTEMVTGIDLVKEQLRVASGEPLSFSQDDVRITGHAIECRINAEDPSRNFAPTPGRITMFHPPGGPGVRLDTHIYEDYEIGPHYDSLLAKIICHGKDRDEAIARMIRALEELVVEGPSTSTPFHLAVLEEPTFLAGLATTKYIEEHADELGQRLAARLR